MLSSIVALTFIYLINGIYGEHHGCTTVAEVFAQPIIEDNISGMIVSATGSDGTGLDVGDLDLWADNPLKEADIDGPSLGLSSGSCTLLPGALKWMCNMEMVFDDGSIILSGISLNDNDPAHVAIVGGTGCYEGASGTVEMTALSLVNEFDAFQYVLIE